MNVCWYFAGRTVSGISFDFDNSLSDSQLHEYILYVQEHISDTAAIVPALRSTDREQKQTE